MKGHKIWNCTQNQNHRRNQNKNQRKFKKTQKEAKKAYIVHVENDMDSSYDKETNICFMENYEEDEETSDFSYNDLFCIWNKSNKE